MHMFDGIITLEDTEIPVVVGFDSTVLRLSSNGAEIGEWSPGEYAIDLVREGVYSITAENESLYFVPSQPKLFAQGLTAEMAGRGSFESPNVGRHTVIPAVIPTVTPPIPYRAPPASSPSSPMVRLGFYALSALTVGLGIWAAYNMFF